MRRRNRPPSVVLASSTSEKVCACGGRTWAFSTNGDGSSMQGCRQCGVWFPIGRYYQDHAAGVRLIAFSWWSSLEIRKGKS